MDKKRNKETRGNEQRLERTKSLFNKFVKVCLVGKPSFLSYTENNPISIEFDWTNIDLSKLKDDEYKKKEQIKNILKSDNKEKSLKNLLEYALWFLDLVGTERSFLKTYTYKGLENICEKCEKGTNYTGIGSSRQVYSGSKTSAYLDVLRVWKYAKGAEGAESAESADAVKQNILSFVNSDQSKEIQEPIKNAFRFLCAPDYYEPIFSQSAKRNIVEGFAAFYDEVSVSENKDAQKKEKESDDVNEKHKTFDSNITDSPFKNAPDIDKKIYIIRKVLESKNGGYGLELNFSFYDKGIVDVWKETSNLKEMSEIQLLEYKKAMVLYGPPGTSKTHGAKDLAYKLIARHYIDRNENLDKVLHPYKEWKDAEMEKYVHTLQMHVNYSYDDFIAGTALEPDGNGGMKSVPRKGDLLKFLDEIRYNNLKDLKNILDTIEDDTLKEIKDYINNSIEKIDAEQTLSNKATSDNNKTKISSDKDLQDELKKWVENQSEDKGQNESTSPQSDSNVPIKDKIKDLLTSPHPYVLILDEINRTDVSRVFGELFSAMEYRNKPIKTSIGGFDLVIPDNLYIIGTMNEIDFSLEHIDFALRRRFVWVHKGFDPEALQDILEFKWKDDEETKGKLESKMEEYIKQCENLNKKISEEDSLGENYQIGHTFFAEIVPLCKQTGSYDKAIKVLWQISIKPTLDAYCGSMPQKKKEDFIKDCEETFMP